MTNDEAWTPYGLEHLRAQSIRKRRYVSLAAVTLLALVWSGLSDEAVNTQTDVSAAGGGSTIEVEVPEQEEDTGPDAVVRISPGRIVRADEADAQAASPPPAAPPRPAFQADPVNWLYYLLLYGPYVLIGLILWAGFRRRPGKNDEVNFGVYKGAMPLEMITASHAHLIISNKVATRSLFGRSREDHVPEDDG